MMTKSEIKLVRSLHQKKFRDELGLFIAEGDKCINELRKHFELVLLADASNATAKEIEQMSMLRTPQGSIAVFKQVNSPLPTTLNAKRSTLNALTLVLDGIQDPGNLGTIIRTADWFGVHDIVCSLDTVDCYNPKVVQATMGALTRVRVHYTDLVEWLSTLNSQFSTLPIYGTLLDGNNLYEETSICNNQSTICNNQFSILIMGNEGNGISQSVRSLVTHPIRIPSFPPDAETSESLNVAIATAIVLAEFRRPK
ncbi:MAG: RNA methyltransferase [Bacteroidales bacterium]|nr:RNA methyltransferase [Candidatus Colicola equi]